jgi:hypothetical protein
MWTEGLRDVVATREPADQCTQYGADLGCERESGREAHHEAERDAYRGSDGDGGSYAHCASLRPIQQRATVLLNVSATDALMLEPRASAVSAAKPAVTSARLVRRTS